MVQFGQVQFGFLLVALGYLFVRTNPLRYVRFHVPTVRDGIWVVGLLTPIPFLSSPGREWLVAALIATPILWVVVFVCWFLISVPAEELLFRGIIQKRLRERFSVPFAIRTAAGLFGGVHVIFTLYIGGNCALSDLVVFSVIGGVFGTAYEQTNNLVVPTVVHAVFWLSPVLLFTPEATDGVNAEAVSAGQVRIYSRYEQSKGMTR